MSAATVLVRELIRRGVRFHADRDSLVVDAPIGVLNDAVKADLLANKPEVLRLVREPRTLAEVAADRLPFIRFTIRETGNMQRDFDLVGRARQVIQEFQPGGNHVYLKIVTPEGKRVTVEWRALVERELRLDLARVLAAAGRASHDAR